MSFAPTDEQRAALDLFLRGESMVIDAGAGTGKTSTLVLLAAGTRARGRYLAFNKAIVTDVAGRLPERCPASTAHSMAFQAVGKRYRHRLNSPRMKSMMIARQLGISPLDIAYGGQRKGLAAGWLAGQVMRAVTRYCQTADDDPGRQHFPYVEGIDVPTADGKRTYANNDRLRAHLEAALGKAWADVASTTGQLPFKHEHYLKLWQLDRPRIEADYILFDEAQDANPVMAAVVAAQDHAQRVYVGDENQAIYEWTGAVNAMGGFDAEHRTQLSQSFRFGHGIAERANEILEVLDAGLRLRGLDSIASTVGELDDGEQPDALLCRTNAAALGAVLAAQAEGQPVHLVGGGTEVAAFARAAIDLKAGRGTTHYELSCFDSWGEVQDYCRDDVNGDELALMVRLIDEFTAPTILKAVDGTTPEGDGVLTVSTAHKSKGREWGIVKIGGDFADVEQSTPELRLRYVAMTRARWHLDASALDPKPDEARR